MTKIVFRLLLIFVLVALEVVFAPSLSFGSTFVVNNTSDSGAGSFRQAIIDANATEGKDTISFNISGTTLKTISPQSALPAIVDPVVIDGTTQPGVGKVELNGANAGSNPGLRLLAGNSVVKGLIINRFKLEGIHIEGPGMNLVQGNFIGTDSTGSTARANGYGVLITSSSDNQVGGTNPSDLNLISANADVGVYILNGDGNVVQGNYVGTKMAGTVALGNANHGILVYNGARNLVGGYVPGARNIVSGNNGDGIYLFGSDSRENIVVGNYVGTDVTGTTAIANRGDGVTVSDGSRNLIGDASGGNVISGNTQAGVFIFGSIAVENRIQGNLIGTDASGGKALGNTLAGITFANTKSNFVGGNAIELRNTVSGNKQDGIFMTNSVGIVVSGNFLGTDVTGAKAVSNAFYGITVRNSNSNLVGGAVSGGNVVSGNGTGGILIVGSSSRNTLLGNLVGCDPSGKVAVPNRGDGVGISSAPANNVGSTVAGEGNLISGNLHAGISLFRAGATANRIVGNRIGTTQDGSSALGNQWEGVYVELAPSNSIGGLELGAANLISANQTRGVFLTNAAWNVLQGNWIGVAADGISPLGNTFHAVECELGATNNVIGGSGGEGNRIGNSQTIYSGVRIRDGSLNNRIAGNSIFGNGGLAIDLGAFGTTSNDACDADAGANRLQNFPLLARASAGNGVQVEGSLNSTANRTFLLQFFAAPAAGPANQQVFVGEASVTTAANCAVAFNILLDGAVPPGFVLTATATDAGGNTSEFSAAIPVEQAPSLAFIAGPAAGTITFSWPQTSTHFVLMETHSLSSPVQWSKVTGDPVLSNGSYQQQVSGITGTRFYVLIAD